MIQFLTSWNGHEFGSIADLGGAEAGLITAGIARTWTPGIEQFSDIVAKLRFNANGDLVGIVGRSASGAETVLPIDSSTVIPTTGIAAGKVLGANSTTPGDYSWIDPPQSANTPAATVSYSSALPLDTIGPGKKFASQVLVAPVTFSVAPGAVPEGNLAFCLEGDGNSAHVPTFPSPFVYHGTAYDYTQGQQNVYAVVYQYGAPHVFRQLGALVVQVPGQVTGVTAGTATSTTQPLTWAAPATGGAPTDYRVEYKLHSSGTWLVFADGVGTALAATVTGLTSNSSYDYRITALNSAGDGTPSATLTVSTAGSATLSSAQVSLGTTLDLNAAGFRDYLWMRSASGANLQKTGRPFFYGLTTLRATAQVAGAGIFPTLSATDTVNAANGGAVGSFSAADATQYNQASAGQWYWKVQVPAGTAQQKVRIHFGGKRNDSFSCPGRGKITCTLSDGSAAPITITNAAPSGNNVTVGEAHEITFAAGSNGQNLEIMLTAAAGDTVGDFIDVQLVALL